MLAKIFLCAISFYFFTPAVFSQDVKVHKLIGKNLETVISKYGKPAHQDRSNPAMECIFYKTQTYQLVFVADNQGVFQAEASKVYNDKSSAINSLDKMISECIAEGCNPDTINAHEFGLQGGGFKANLSLFENTYSKKYEIKVKANRSAN